MAFTSCSKKDLDCTCTTSTTSSTGGETITEAGEIEVFSFEGVKKDKAALECPASYSNTDSNENSNGVITTRTFTRTCELK